MRFSFTNRTLNPLEATDFLRRDPRLAALLPAAQRMAELQRACHSVLPPAFACCEILAFDGASLTLSVPNAALGAKLKQQVPAVQAALAAQGWQINNIRLKVQMARGIAPPAPSGKGLRLPEMAVDAFADLSDKMEATDANGPLIAAMKALVARRRG